MRTLPQDATDLWVVSQTVYGESRGESEAGQTGVAWVIRNRQRYHSTWQGMTLAAICQAPYQFSCWNPDDPNCAALQALTLANAGFAAIVGVVTRVLSDDLASPVGQATHYYADSIAEPYWAEGESPVAIIGHHRFYEGIA